MTDDDDEILYDSPMCQLRMHHGQVKAVEGLMLAMIDAHVKMTRDENEARWKRIMAEIEDDIKNDRI